MSDVSGRNRSDDRFRNDPQFTRSRDSQGSFWRRGDEDRVLTSPEQQFETSAPYRQPADHRTEERVSHAGRGPKGYLRGDARIREDVCDSLSSNDDVDATDITVLVSAGEVTLEGSVATRHMKRLATDIAEGVPGVVDVHNTIRTRQPVLTELRDKLEGKADEAHHGGTGTHQRGPAPTRNGS